MSNPVLTNVIEGKTLRAWVPHDSNEKIDLDYEVLRNITTLIFDANDGHFSQFNQLYNFPFALTNQLFCQKI